MRHLQRDGVVGLLRLVAALALAVLASPAARAAHPACQWNVAPLVVVDQRLFRHDGLLVADVVVGNVEASVLRNVHVAVELYDFVGELLRAERTILNPSVLPAGYRASFRVATPFTQDVRTIGYRFTGLRDADSFQSLVVCDAAL